MRHGITRLLLGEYQFLEVSEDRFAQLVDARRNVLESLYIEEKFTYLIDNYWDLEIEALANTARNATLPFRRSSEVIADIHLFNRRIINLLTTSRLYIDHTPHHLTAIFGDNSPEEQQFKSRRSTHYDNSLSYRLLEALRNYVQHRGLPLSGLRRNHRLTDPGKSNSFCVHSIQLGCATTDR